MHGTAGSTTGREASVVARGPDEGEALWFFGELATIRLAGEDTAEQFAIVEHQSPQGMSPPWHVQPGDDETFHVLEGEITFWAGDPSQPICVAGPGSVVCVPRGTPHSFRIESDQARWLSVHTPAGHERFYRAGGTAAPTRTLPPSGVPDIPRAQAAGQRHGVEFLGPPPGGEHGR